MYSTFISVFTFRLKFRKAYLIFEARKYFLSLKLLSTFESYIKKQK